MSYTKTNLSDVEDQAAKHGFGELQEARFPRTDVGAERGGIAHIKVRAGQRQPFAHRHKEAEEIHVILAGGGRMKVDDDTFEVGEGDVVRVEPSAARAFEAGPDGLEYIVFSTRHENDAEIVKEFWD
jgi:mannose-6-phosphate isomerase-like protein (cupin superfamily)